MEKTLTDILLICKGWYNKEKYKNPLEAMGAYYHKHYRCEDIAINKALANTLFLQPLAIEAIKRKPELVIYLFMPAFNEKRNDEFSDVLYERLLSLVLRIKHGTFDLSEHEKEEVI